MHSDLPFLHYLLILVYDNLDRKFTKENDDNCWRVSRPRRKSKHTI